MALLVKADRTTQLVFAEDLPASKGNGGEFELKDLNNFVGGYLQHVRLRSSMVASTFTCFVMKTGKARGMRPTILRMAIW